MTIKIDTADRIIIDGTPAGAAGRAQLVSLGE